MYRLKLTELEKKTLIDTEIHSETIKYNIYGALSSEMLDTQLHKSGEESKKVIINYEFVIPDTVIIGIYRKYFHRVAPAGKAESEMKKILTRYKAVNNVCLIRYKVVNNVCMPAEILFLESTRIESTQLSSVDELLRYIQGGLYKAKTVWGEEYTGEKAKQYIEKKFFEQQGLCFQVFPLTRR